MSASTLHTEAKALGKLYGICPDDEDYYQPPQRRREDIKRSRGPAKRDKHFSLKNVIYKKRCATRKSCTPQTVENISLGMQIDTPQVEIFF